MLDRTERLRAIAAVERELVATVHSRRDALAIARSRDLFGAPTSRGAGDRAQRCQLRVKVRLLRARLRAYRDGAALPFMFAAQFADADAAGGFDVVLGNPPWVRPHADPLADRTRLAREFRVSRDAAWVPGRGPRPRGATFGAQVDLAALFVERAVSLASDGGTIALLLPAKLWRCLAGGGVRRLLAGETSIRSIEDWSAARPAFDAAVYPSLLVTSKEFGPGTCRGPGASPGSMPMIRRIGRGLLFRRESIRAAAFAGGIATGRPPLRRIGGQPLAVGPP